MSDAGEIIGRLKLDASDWMAKLEEAKGEAESLKAVDPTITVKAETGTAVAKLSTVAAAEERYKAAVQSSERASAQAALAQMRLDEVQNRRGRTAYQVAAAEEALRYATQRSEDAAAKATLAEDVLTAARRRARDAAAEEAAAVEVSAVASRNAGSAANSAGGAATRAAGPMAYLIGTAVALAPALVPISAAAVGITGALTGMGVAGGLAIAGISREITAGKGPLLEYKSSLSTLQSALHGLEDIAGKALFPGVQASVGILKANMGEIQTMVGIAAKQLGTILPTALQGILSMIRALQPAFAAGEKVIADLVKGFAQFAQSSAFKGFVDYIVKSMPIVEQFLGATINLAGRLLIALAPLGSSILRSLTPVLNALAQQMPAVGRALSSLVPLIPSLTRAIVAALPVIGQLLRTFASMVTILTPVLIPALKGVTATLQAVSSAMKPGVQNAENMARAFAQFTSGVAPARIALEALNGKLGPVIQGFARFGVTIRQALTTAQGVVAQFVSTVSRDFKAVQTALTGVQDRFKAVFSVIGKVVENGFLLVVGLFILAERKIVATLAPFAKTIEGVIQSAMKQIERVVGPALNTVESLFSHAWSSITSRTSSGANAVTGTFRSAFSTIDRVVASAINSVVSTISRGISRIVSAVSSGIGRAVAVFNSFRSRVLGAVAGFGSLLYGAGQNLVEGLINGAASMVGSLIGVVSNIAGSAIAAARNALGIRSPSRVFHGIGVNLVEGFVNGISSGHGAAHAAINGLVSGRASGLNMGALGGAGIAVPSASMMSSSTVSRTFAPQVHIYNPVAVDPVQQVIDANQYVLAYSGLW